MYLKRRTDTGTRILFFYIYYSSVRDTIITTKKIYHVQLEVLDVYVLEIMQHGGYDFDIYRETQSSEEVENPWYTGYLF